MHVLSIDIDYAYSPTISTYDDHVEGSRVTLEEQKLILEDLGMPAPKVNSRKLDVLKEVVRKKTNHLTPVIICEHHNEILNYLPKDSVSQSRSRVELEVEVMVLLELLVRHFKADLVQVAVAVDTMEVVSPDFLRNQSLLIMQ